MTAELKVIFFEGAKLLRVKIGVHFSGYSRVLKTTSNARNDVPRRLLSFTSFFLLSSWWCLLRGLLLSIPAIWSLAASIACLSAFEIVHFDSGSRSGSLHGDDAVAGRDGGRRRCCGAVRIFGGLATSPVVAQATPDAVAGELRGRRST